MLDIGAGRNPAITKDRRPPAVEYVGLDLSAEELSAAGPGEYSATVVADLKEFRPELAERFDLALSWQVLEHVEDLELALTNVRRYLRDGGVFVALFSGSWSVFGVLNRLLPDAIGHRIVDRVMNRTATNRPVFPAYYDSCYASALRRLSTGWKSLEIVPRYQGATYFRFSRVLTRGYLLFENRAEERNWDNLASHYLIVAER